MARYVPTNIVRERGRQLMLLTTYATAYEQLRGGERLCALMRRTHGLVSLVVESTGDFESVLRDGGHLENFYAIGPDILKLAED